MINLDTRKLGGINGTGDRITGDRSHQPFGWNYLRVAIDDCSLPAYTEMLTAETGEACAGFLARATARFADHGASLRRVITDNDFVYTNCRAHQTDFKQLSARHGTSRLYRPRTNGKGEPFFQTALSAAFEWPDK